MRIRDMAVAKKKPVKRKPRKKVAEKSRFMTIMNMLTLPTILILGVSGWWFNHQKLQELNVATAVHTIEINKVSDKVIIPDHIAEAEDEYWHAFRTTHKGTALGPVKRGERLYAKWEIMRRPACIEAQFFVILNPDKTYQATVFSNLTVPSSNKVYGKTKERYRTDARDRRMNFFESTEGLDIPTSLPNGKYLLSYTYFFINCDHEYPSTLNGLQQPNQLVEFEIID